MENTTARLENHSHDKHAHKHTDTQTACVRQSLTQTLCTSPSHTYWLHHCKVPRSKVNTLRGCTTSHSVVKWVCIHHSPMLWRLLTSDSKHRPESVLNANSVLCNQQTADNVQQPVCYRHCSAFAWIHRDGITQRHFKGMFTQAFKR